MITMGNIRRQLANAGFKNKILGWSAARELPNILTDDEVIEKVITGMYEAGYAMLVATDRRILFLDKKPMSFALEDIPYDMVSEVEYRISPFRAHLTIHCSAKDIELSSIRQAQVQHFAVHVENHVNLIRSDASNWAKMVNFPSQQKSSGVAPIGDLESELKIR